jgi:hypothetical protein
MGIMVRFQVAARHKLPAPNSPRRFWGPHNLLFSVYPESSPGVRWPEPEAGPSLPSSAEVGMSGAVPPLAHMSSWHAKRQLLICLLSQSEFHSSCQPFLICGPVRQSYFSEGR